MKVLNVKLYHKKLDKNTIASASKIGKFKTNRGGCKFFNYNISSRRR
jgi:hypothetical protein